ncbi:MAG TPA: peptidoglycan-binding domain-containing protein [Azospirillum sp.]
MSARTLKDTLVRLGYAASSRLDNRDPLADMLLAFQQANNIGVTGVADDVTCNLLAKRMEDGVRPYRQSAPADPPIALVRPPAAQPAPGGVAGPAAGNGSTVPEGQGQAPPAMPAEMEKVALAPPPKPPAPKPSTLPPIAPGQAVLAVEKVECVGRDEAFVTFYSGFAGGMDGDLVGVQLGKRFAVWYDRRYRDLSSESWECTPRRMLCFSAVKFTSWSGTRAPDESVTFPRAGVAAGSPDEATVKREIEKWIHEKCPALR